MKLIIIEILNIYHFQEIFKLNPKEQSKNIKDVNYQNLFEALFRCYQYVKISISGLDNIEKNKGYLFVSIIEI